MKKPLQLSFSILFFQTIFYQLSFVSSSIYYPPVGDPEGYEINDLAGSTAEVEAFAREWTLQNFDQPSPSTIGVDCLGGWLLGGLPITATTASLERTYTYLPSHKYVTIAFTLLLLDEWDPSNRISVHIDGQEIHTMNPLGASTALCGNNGVDDNYYAIVGKFPHTGDSLTLKISGEILTTAHPFTSFGIFAVSLNFYEDALGSPPENLLSPMFYDCNFGDCTNTDSALCGVYMLDTCSGTCDTGCSLCVVGASQCLACKNGFYFNGVDCQPCTVTNCAKCSANVDCFRCLSTEFWHSDMSCQGSCNDPPNKALGEHFQYCVLPCPPGQFMYWNYTCESSCEFPLEKTLGTGLGDFCSYPCQNQEYLSWEGVCLETCPSEDIRVENFKQFCKEPGTGGGGGGGPVEEEDEEETDEELESIQAISSITSTAGSVAGFGLALTNVFFISDPSRLLSGSLQQMLDYTRFLNITHSRRLAIFYNESDLNSDTIMPILEMNEEMKAKFELRELPYMFQKFEVHSSFLVNCWDDLFQYVVFLGILVFFITLDFSFKWVRNIPRLHSAVKRARLITINYILGQFYEGLGIMIFYAGLQFYSTGNINSVYSFFSLFIPIVCIILGVAMLAVNGIIVRKYQQIKQSKGGSAKEASKELNKFNLRFESLQILYEDFKDLSFPHQAYLLFLTSRSILFNILIVFATQSPHVQVFFIILTHLTILGYFAIKKPIKSTLNLIQQTMFELALLCVNLSWLIMAIIDKKDNKESELRNHLSEVVIVMNVIFTFIPIGFIAIKFFFLIKDAVAYFSELRNAKKRTAPGKKGQENNNNQVEGEVSQQENSEAVPIQSLIFLGEQKSLKGLKGVDGPSFHLSTFKLDDEVELTLGNATQKKI